MSGYTGFSGNSDYQEGNYLALKFVGDKKGYLTMELVNGLANLGEVKLDDDGIIIVRVTDKVNQSLVMRQYIKGKLEDVFTYSFSDLTLEEPEVEEVQEP